MIKQKEAKGQKVKRNNMDGWLKREQRINGADEDMHDLLDQIYSAAKESARLRYAIYNTQGIEQAKNIESLTQANENKDYLIKTMKDKLDQF